MPQKLGFKSNAHAHLDGTGDPWFLGHFMPEGHPLHSRDVEIKWGRHATGEEKHQWVRIEATTIAIHIRGRTEIYLSRDPRSENPELIELRNEGDFLLIPSGLWHRWRVLEDTLAIAVRWPSHP